MMRTVIITLLLASGLLAQAPTIGNSAPSSSTGGTCSGLAGDVTGTCAANTVNGIKSGVLASIPASCTPTGSVNIYLATDQTAGQNVYACTAADTWTLQIGASITPPPTPGFQPSQPLSGCGVEYVSGLTYTAGACSYTINGQTFNAPLTNLTLSAADPTNPRIDVIGVDSTGAWFVSIGTPAVTPSAPTTDASTQLQITFAVIAATASVPTGVTATSIYLENTEWTSTCSAHFNCASTNNPYTGTKDIEATTAVSGNSVTLVKPAAGTVNLSAFNTLTFYIRSKAQWPTGNGTGANGLRTLSIFWKSGSTQVGAQIVLRDGQFGFSSATTSSYQQVSIPVSSFATGSATATTLAFVVSGNGGTSSIGFYLDQISLQAGSASPVLPATLMNWRGTYSTTTAYNVNDLVVSSGIGYVALAQNTNVAVSTAATWAPLSPTTGTLTIASGTSALGTSAISSNACATVVTTVATGTATTDNIMADFNSDPSAVTGYVAGAMLTIVKYPTANNVNFLVCNNTANTITPGARTLNWRVVR